VFYRPPIIIIPCRVFLVFLRGNVNTTGARVQMVTASKLPLKGRIATTEALADDVRALVWTSGHRYTGCFVSHEVLANSVYPHEH